MYQNMVKSGLISGGHMVGYENMAGFRPGPRPDMISGATLIASVPQGSVLGQTLYGLHLADWPRGWWNWRQAP